MASLATSLTQPAESSLLTLRKVVTLDVGNGLLGGDVLDGEGSTDARGVTLGLALGGESSLGGVDLVGGRVKLLELTTLAGEEDQTGLVVLQTSDIGGQGLLGVVDTAVVDGDTNGGSELLGDTSFLNGPKNNL